MSSTNESIEIRTRYNSLRDLSIPVSWPNESFTVPNPPTIYARFSIVNGDEGQINIGSQNPVFRRLGLIYISLFAPPNTGDGIIRVKADDVAKIFRNWCGATIRCRAATVKSLGIDKATGWFQVNVVIPFQQDEII